MLASDVSPLSPSSQALGRWSRTTPSQYSFPEKGRSAAECRRASLSVAGVASPPVERRRASLNAAVGRQAWDKDGTRIEAPSSLDGALAELRRAVADLMPLYHQQHAPSQDGPPWDSCPTCRRFLGVGHV
ncbi:hypothetical protein SAMN04488504_10294 [Myxococcus virescens]|uniref:Uncharacterized protein n=1 Tax=Myxococcus virescens TaxID=83456 RepID=A0ABY0MMD3_9BACT|nr:hypothetical protein SAMN04488504_10294 [Myxococcus virescens]